MEHVTIPWATALMLYKTGEWIMWWSEDTGSWYSVLGPEFFAANKNHRYRICPHESRDSAWRRTSTAGRPFNITIG